MNAKFFAAFTTIVLVLGLRQPVTHAHAPQIVLNSIGNNVLVQRSSKKLKIQPKLISPLPSDTGIPESQKSKVKSQKSNLLASRKKDKEDPPPPRPLQLGGGQ